jgi:hypothetical protein
MQIRRFSASDVYCRKSGFSSQSLVIYSSLVFRWFIISGSANSRGRPKNKKIHHSDLAVLGASQLFDNSNRSSNHSASCSRELKGEGRRSHHTFSAKERNLLKKNIGDAVNYSRIFALRGGSSKLTPAKSEGRVYKLETRQLNTIILLPCSVEVHYSVGHPDYMGVGWSELPGNPDHRGETAWFRSAVANRWSAWWSVEKFGHYLQILCLLYCFIIFWFVFVSPTQDRWQFSPYYVASNSRSTK